MNGIPLICVAMLFKSKTEFKTQFLASGYFDDIDCSIDQHIVSISIKFNQIIRLHRKRLNKVVFDQAKWMKTWFENLRQEAKIMLG